MKEIDFFKERDGRWFISVPELKGGYTCIPLPDSAMYESHARQILSTGFLQAIGKDYSSDYRNVDALVLFLKRAFDCARALNMGINITLVPYKLHSVK